MITEIDCDASKCVENISNLIINKPYTEPPAKKSFSERLMEVFNR
jgi:hypothetical protein